MPVMIAVQNLHYRYGEGAETPVDALRGINLTLQEGEYLAIVGLNGSGKSTLARCLNGLLTPTAGDVWVQGRNTRDHGARTGIRAAVGMVFQNPENQFVTSRVEDEVAFGPENLGVPRRELRVRVDEALAHVGLSGAGARDPHTLSAGEKARLAIASVLAMRPAVLVLDEATAMLDPVSRAQTMALVRDLHGGGLTVVAITHHLTEVTDAGRLVVLNRGRIALQGKPADVFARGAALAAAGLPLPPAAAIAAGLRGRGVPLAANAVTPDALVDAVVAVRAVTP